MKLFSIFIQMLFCLSLLSQSVYQTNWKISNPLPFELILSANFGELRSSSFHTGLDFKTQQKENIPVYAIDDGFVSRVVVSKTGYGKAIYVTHNNGYTSVYAHLRNFYPYLSEFVKSKQYEQKSYEINLYLPNNKFIVKKGQLIGFSGNTGNSFGPHLHFEIRNENEEPLNPITFFPGIKDTYMPVIKSLCFYKIYDNSCNSYLEDNRFCISPLMLKGKYFLNDTIYLYGKVGLGIEAYDKINSTNICGIYSIDLFLNDKKIYSVKFDKLSFEEQKYYKGFIDYEVNLKEKKRIYKLFVDPNNKLSVYKHHINNGIIEFYDENKTSKFNIILKDKSGKKAELEFYVKAKNGYNVNNKKNILNYYDYYDSICYDKEYSVSFEECKVLIPSYTLFRDICFTYKKYLSNEYLSNIHEIGNTFIPTINKINVEILPNKYYGADNKVLMCEIVDNKVSKVYKTTKSKENFYKSEVNNFGRYALVVDTIPPECTPEFYSSSSRYKKNDTITFIIKDNLSEIIKYEAYIDEKWVLLEYDLKNNRVFYVIDDNRLVRDKKHKLVIILEDLAENRSIYEYSFYY